VQSRDVSATCKAAKNRQVTEILLADDSKLLRMARYILPKWTGLDVLKMLKKDAAAAEIPVVILPGLSPKNAERLHKDGAFAFLATSARELEKGSDALLAAVADIVKRLPQAHHSGGGKC
jgi:hypothetical protein